MSTERLHHPFSPSTLQTREASPCYHPRGGTSEAAEAGTRQHDATEHEDHANPLLSDDQSKAVAECVALLDAAVREMGVGATVEKEGYWPIDDVTFLHEGKTWVGTTAGYSDATLFSAVSEGPSNPSLGIEAVRTQHIHVVDWKFGKFPVEPAETNLQGWAYVLGVVHRQAKRGIIVESARVTFHCPHLEETTTHLFHAEDFASMRARINEVVAKARTADRLWKKTELAPMGTGPQNVEKHGLIIPTTSSCLFCGRIAECPVIGRMAVMVSSKYKPLVVPPDITGDKLCTDEQASHGLAIGKALEEWAKSYRQKITSRAIEEDGFTPEGYSLIVTEPRKVVDKPALWDRLVARFGFTRVLEDFVSLPLTPIESAIEDAEPMGEKSKASAAFATELAEAGITVKSTAVISLRMKPKKK
jgi:hypothetical protein